MPDSSMAADLSWKKGRDVSAMSISGAGGSGIGASILA